MKVGEEYRYIGNDGRFYTEGKTYFVRGKGNGMFRLDDDAFQGDEAKHWWPDDADFRAAFELVDTQEAGPVRTETITRQVIVPGIYGVFKISRGAHCPFLTWKEDSFINLGGDQRSRDKLDAAIATLTVIRAALEDDK